MGNTGSHKPVSPSFSGINEEGEGTDSPPMREKADNTPITYASHKNGGASSVINTSSKQLFSEEHKLSDELHEKVVLYSAKAEREVNKT